MKQFKIVVERHTNRYVAYPLFAVCFLSIPGCLLLTLSAAAVPGLKVLAKHTQTLPRGMNVTRFVVGREGKSLSPSASQSQVSLTFLWSTRLGGPEVYSNGDHSLMAMQTMPYWRKTGRVRDGRRICLLVSTPKQGIKVFNDFSGRINRLRLANVSQWEPLAGHYHRPASTIFLTPQSMVGREIRASQYAIDPEVGFPEYNNLGVKVDREGKLSFLCFTSQGF